LKNFNKTMKRFLRYPQTLPIPSPQPDGTQFLGVNAQMQEMIIAMCNVRHLIDSLH
jgi:hypothetical protein